MHRTRRVSIPNRYQIHRQKAIQKFRHLAAEQNQQRRAYRWGRDAGHCVVDGQKVLGSYELFRRPGPMEQAVWAWMIRGLSTRNYGAYGVEKSATSGHFIQASRQKLQEVLERSLRELRLRPGHRWNAL